MMIIIISLQSKMYTSQITYHTVLLFVRRKMKVINLQVYIYDIQRKEKAKAQMNNQSSISYSEQQHFLFITLASNRVRVLYKNKL